MKKLKLIIQEFESLNPQEQETLKGGFVSGTIAPDKGQQSNEKNYFQCGCNNYCHPQKQDPTGPQ